MFVSAMCQQVSIDDAARKAALVDSGRAMGNGERRDLHDLVFVNPDDFDTLRTREIAEEIGRINARLDREKRDCILVGFGRWATADPHLGIPVKWHQISRARVFVEATCDSLTVEPSQGSHFFHNMLSLRRGYLHVE